MRASEPLPRSDTGVAAVRLTRHPSEYTRGPLNGTPLRTPTIHRMNDRILDGIFSFSGLALALATAGFLSAIVTMFVDVGANVPMRVLLFVVFIAMCLLIILMKIIHDLSAERKPDPAFEHPIKYIPEERIFVIRRNEHFLNNIVVGCYSNLDDVDRLAYVAVVHLMQDKVIQIKMHNDLGVLKSIPSTAKELQSLVIRPVVPFTALQQY